MHARQDGALKDLLLALDLKHAAASIRQAAILAELVHHALQQVALPPKEIATMPRSR